MSMVKMVDGFLEFLSKLGKRLTVMPVQGLQMRTEVGGRVTQATIGPRFCFSCEARERVLCEEGATEIFGARDGLFGMQRRKRQRITLEKRLGLAPWTTRYGSWTAVALKTVLADLSDLRVLPGCCPAGVSLEQPLM